MKTNQIICGEAKTVLSEFPSEAVDLVVTDPPYLCSYKDRDGRTVRNDTNAAAVLPVFDELYRVMKPNSYCISFYGWNAIAEFSTAWKQAGFKTIGHIVWAKDYASKVSHTKYQHESAFVLAKGFPKKPANPINDVQPWIYTGNRSHPTEKSVDVIAPLIQAFSRPGEIVLDPFAGSGTTAIASALNKRRFISIELEARYCDLTEKRLAGLMRWQSAQQAA